MTKRCRPFLKGFTIIELLVVAAIIALLAGVVLVVLSYTRERGQDASRKETLHQIRNSLELYHLDFGSYPPTLNDLIPDYLSAIPPNYDIFYDTNCANYGGSLGAEILGTCFVLDVPLTEAELAQTGQCWRDDPVGVGPHPCY